MGFDWIKCNYPLPDERAQDIIFETKSLGGFCENYTISQDGKLLVYRLDTHYRKIVEINLLWHGKIHIYSDLCLDDNTHFSYDVRFVKGLVKEIVISQFIQKQKTYLPTQKNDSLTR